ncbi:MAG: alpha/beta hydrolase, partial [Pseudonocardia sp.]|nr:alpha/beta hydrolase [Pseudonocardia sp.]
RPPTDRGGVRGGRQGGGWVRGDLDTHDPLCRRVANAIGAVVVSVDYRLAPEHPHPAPLDDAQSALRAVSSWFPDRPIGVAGDSAGASLAAGLALRARDGGPAIVAQLLFYPSTDPSQARPSVTENGEGYFLTATDVRWFYDQYLPGGSDDPQVDLLAADVRGVAPAVVATAEFDPLRDEGLAYADLLERSGVTVRRIPGPGLIHGYAAFLGVVDAAERATADALNAMSELLTAG